MRNAIIREGITAGVVGATTVAVWFLLIDTLFGGGPLHTPIALGRALFSGVLGWPPADASGLVFVVEYTLFHYAAFVLVGLLAASIVHLGETEPTVLVGAFILFVVLEMGFHLFLSILPSFPVLGVVAWYNVAIGNVLAAATMGGYLWRLHPRLLEKLGHALRDEE